jgi:hypothetical protein
MFGWFVDRMRTYGFLAARFRRRYDDITNQQYERVQEKINALPVEQDEKDRLLDWAAGVRQREYLDRVPVAAKDSKAP